jgi:hypothetical protein
MMHEARILAIDGNMENVSMNNFKRIQLNEYEIKALKPYLNN